jgi:putative redox protein
MLKKKRMKIEVTFDGNKKVNANINGYVVKTDQPLSKGGDATAPTPFDLFLASIGTCAGIYVKSFCDQRELPIENIKIVQEIFVDEITKMVSDINIEIQIPSDFPEKYKDALISVANLCAVKKHIANPPLFDVYTKTV